MRLITTPDFGDSPQYLVITDPLLIKQALVVTDLLSLMWEYETEIRKVLKHGESDVQFFIDKWTELKESRNIDLEELYP